jgi:glycerol-3-phosphate dehydrogenase
MGEHSLKIQQANNSHHYSAILAKHAHGVFPLSPSQSAAQPNHHIDTDLIIIGGGIAGLWLLNKLTNQGYKAVLFEQGELGEAQSIASQGMIHGGIKYALGGALTGSSEAIADMPDHWRRCLKGEGDVDLRHAKVLSEFFYLWSTASLGSKVTSFFASKLTRGRADKLKSADYPSHFQHPDFKGHVYKLVDLVMDTPSVLQALYDNYAERIFKIDWQHAQWCFADGSVSNNGAGHINNTDNIDDNINNTQAKITGLRLHQDGQCWQFNCQEVVFSAGAGNEDLCQSLAIQSVPMQRRPLQQVMLSSRYPLPLYAHCMGSNPSPRLTISCHPLPSDPGETRWAWYLGGDLATEGTDLPAEQLIAKAKNELNQLFPHIDFSDAQWSTVKLDRAEPKQKGLIKPDKAFAARATEQHRNNVIIAWPTKLTLAPNMADEVIALLAPARGTRMDLNSTTVLNKPRVARAHWQVEFKA